MCLQLSRELERERGREGRREGGREGGREEGRDRGGRYIGGRENQTVRRSGGDDVCGLYIHTRKSGLASHEYMYMYIYNIQWYMADE